MALIVTLVAPSEIVVTDAYVRVAPQALSKQLMSFRVDVFTRAPAPDESLPPVKDFNEMILTCPYDLQAPGNPYQQAYAFLKQQPGFENAVDA